MISEEMKNKCETLIKYFNGTRSQQTHGFILEFEDDLTAKITAPYNPAFDNGVGALHGGMIATMIDNAGWFAAAVHYDSWIATVEFNLQLLEAVKETAVIARAKPARIGKRIAFCRMEVSTPEGLLVAVGSGTYTSIPKIAIKY